MGKKLCLILGNGFSLDFLNYIDIRENIDVINLFKNGAAVPWPINNEPGFLSYKHCPNLWNLGARPNLDDKSAIGLIENILTCINVFARAEKRKGQKELGSLNDIYVYAYKELVVYLKHLFIFYNNMVDDIPDEVMGWPWVKFIKHANEGDKYSEIHIITYNYDIWLERILDKVNIKYCVPGLIDENQKIKIYKPHGSISFTYEKRNDREAEYINYDRELHDGDLDDFSVSYKNLDENYLVNAIIPPAGESSRLNHTWASSIRDKIKELSSKINEHDDVIICGLSYWHVDRAELNEIIEVCDPNVNVKMINPHPTRAITAVLTSIFSNFIVYPNSEILEGLLNA